MNYEDLLIEAANEGIIVKEKSLQSSDGRINGKRIAIRKDIPTQAQKADVLAEELGHYYTTAGRIVEGESVTERKKERTSRLYAYNKRIGLSGIIQGYRKHCHNLYELAQELGVSEPFLAEALQCYREIYAPYVKIDGYIIVFEPYFAVVERINN